MSRNTSIPSLLPTSPLQRQRSNSFSSFALPSDSTIGRKMNVSAASDRSFALAQSQRPRMNLSPNWIDAYSLKNVATAVDSEGKIENIWQEICLRVLPIFNGERERGFIEDLNELVKHHVQRIFSHQPKTRDAAEFATGIVTSDLSELVSLGCLTVSNRYPLSSSQPDSEFLANLNKSWNTFWSTILPRLDALFWVLRTDERFVVSNIQSHVWACTGGIDIRRISLIGFRDHILLPNISRIIELFSEESIAQAANAPLQQSQGPNPASKIFAYSIPSKPQYHNGPGLPNRQQMVAICASLMTGDTRQEELDNLLRVMRAGAGDSINRPTSLISEKSRRAPRRMASESESISQQFLNAKPPSSESSRSESYDTISNNFASRPLPLDMTDLTNSALTPRAADIGSERFVHGNSDPGSLASSNRTLKKM